MKVAVVCIAKNEPHINEWCQYHKKMGFIPHVILNDWQPDFNVEAYTSTVAGRGVQLQAYNSWIKSNALGYDFALFIDADEFFYCQQENVQELLQGRSHSLAINWVFFGSQQSEGTGIVARFRHRDIAAHPTIKTLVRLTPTVRMQSVHFCNGETYSPERIRVTGSSNELGTHQNAFIAHYYTQDKAHWKRKAERGRADTGRNFNYNPLLYDTNQIYDDRLYKFLKG